MFVLQVAVVRGKGGIATAVAHYARMFRDLGVRSAALFRGPSAEALRSEDFDVIDAPPLLTSPLGALPGALSGLRRAIDLRARDRRMIAIVHSDLALGPLKRLFPNADFVIPCHSDKFKRKHAADLVVTLNAAQHEAARAELGPGARIAQLGNPYISAGDARTQGEGPPRLNFIARFIDTKDPLTLLRAAAAIPQAERPHLRFIGAGPLEQELRDEAARLGVIAELPGWSTAPFADFHRGDVLVLPSSWEGLPYLLQEALDHGAPIIASDIAGNRAALADGAYGALFPFGDAPALSRAISSTVADLDAARAKAEKGRAALYARYGGEHFWRALTQALEKADA